MSDDDLNKFRQIVKEEVSTSEQRLEGKMAASAKTVMTDVGSFMEDTLIPLIEEKADKADIERLERKLDRVIDTSIDHETRIKDIVKMN